MHRNQAVAPDSACTAGLLVRIEAQPVPTSGHTTQAKHEMARFSLQLFSFDRQALGGKMKITIIGAGIGGGGNSQFLSYKVYYPKGFTELQFYRINPDLNYSYFIATRDPNAQTPNENVK